MQISEIEKIQKGREYIRSKTDFIPDIAVVLGSGLAGLTREVEVVHEISYGDVPYLKTSTTPFHDGKMIFGVLSGVKVLLMSGRVHLYEGYSVEDVVRPIRLVYELGAKKLILTNASGAINTDYHPGDLVVIKDHISSFVPSPIKGDIRRLIGTKLDFPDMCKVYDRELSNAVLDICHELETVAHEGVYIQVSGAQYETPAEINFYRIIGADLVGMSTVVEATCARHLGMRVVGVSMATNMAAGIEKVKLSHDDVKRVADRAQSKFIRVLKESIVKISTI
ncbi:MAG: purine-nucleoside phosphorylase [Clostridia bacterium]|nr:purine-nucleoside phosphorylase [Clostridia bacterium]